jgi:hypothetical protein
MALGARRPIQVVWVAGRIGLVVYLLLLGAVAFGLTRVERQRPLAIAPAMLLPLVFAVFPTAFYFGEPRYLFAASPLFALGLAITVGRLRWMAPVATGLIVLLAIIDVAPLTHLRRTPTQELQDLAPPPIGPVLSALRREHATHIAGDYWLVERITWESRERIVGTAGQAIRFAAYERAVRRSRRILYVVMTGQCLDLALRASLREAGIAFAAQHAGEVTIITPSRRVLPEEALSDWALVRGQRDAQPKC